jgi:hypothetical protein
MVFHTALHPQTKMKQQRLILLYQEKYGAIVKSMGVQCTALPRNALPTQEVAKNRRILYLQTSGTCYAHSMVNAILMSPMREMMARLGERIESRESTAFLDGCTQFVEDCWQDDSIQGIWTRVRSYTRDLREALKDMSPEDRAIHKEEFEESVQAEQVMFNKIMVERYKSLVNAYSNMQYHTMITLVLAKVCKNMQKFDVAHEKPVVSRNIKVDWLYAMLAGALSATRPEHPTTFVNFEGVQSDYAIIGFLFYQLGAFEGNTANHDEDAGTVSLHIQGEATRCIAVQCPPVTPDTMIDPAAVSGTMMFRYPASHMVAWANIHGRLIMYDSNWSRPKSLMATVKSLVKSWAVEGRPEIPVPQSDDAVGEAMYTSTEWHKPSTHANEIAFTLYFTPADRYSGAGELSNAMTMQSRGPSMMSRATQFQGATRRLTAQHVRRIHQQTDDQQTLLMFLMVLATATESTPFITGEPTGLSEHALSTATGSTLFSEGEPIGLSENSIHGGTSRNSITFGTGVVLATITAIMSLMPR